MAALGLWQVSAMSSKSFSKQLLSEAASCKCNLPFWFQMSYLAFDFLNHVSLERGQLSVISDRWVLIVQSCLLFAYRQSCWHLQTLPQQGFL